MEDVRSKVEKSTVKPIRKTNSSGTASTINTEDDSSPFSAPVPSPRSSMKSVEQQPKQQSKQQESQSFSPSHRMPARTSSYRKKEDSSLSLQSSSDMKGNLVAKNDIQEKDVAPRSAPKRTTSSSSAAKNRRVSSASMSVSLKDVDETASVASRDPPGSRVVPTTITVDGSDNISSGKLEDNTTVGSNSEDSSNAKEAGQFFLQDQYGLEAKPEEEHARETEDAERRMARALCFAIGAEGVYTQDQVEWLVGLFSSKNYHKNIVDDVATMLKEAAKLLELELVVECKRIITEELRKESTLLIYDMYRAASVAHFPNEQMCAIAMIAEEIGVDQFGQLEGIRKQVVAENELKKQRIKLLYPEGHELLDEQYEDLVPCAEEASNQGSSNNGSNESKRRNSSKKLDP